MIEVKGARCPLTFEEVRGLCIRREWFSGGTEDQFAKLAAMIDEGASIDELALVIWLCSKDKETGGWLDRKWVTVMLKAEVMK